MLVVVDIGNTRTKWAQVGEDGRLIAVQACINANLAESALKEAVVNADKVVIANVAGDELAEQVTKMMPSQAEVVFAAVKSEACGVVCHYDVDCLGIDRWASVVAAWHQYRQPLIVINAGTAITVDAVSREKITKKGAYLGGSIMPGLQLLYDALANNTAKLPAVSDAKYNTFPVNTQEAIHAGCINAVVGSVVLQLKNLEKYSAFLPKVVISGGDAVKIAGALNPRIKRPVVIESLVLQGLALLGEAEV